MDDTLSAALAAVLRAERAAQMLTNVTLAERSGLNATSLERWMNGKREITTATLGALAGAMGVPASELMRRAEVRAGRIDPDDNLGEVIEFTRGE